MKSRLTIFIMSGMLACARGERNELPKYECATTADCETGDACHHQECVNGRCLEFLKDSDGDGYVDAMCGAQFNDCNDADAEIKPGLTETCDCADNNCDQAIDDGCNYQMRILDKSTELFGCFTAKNFRTIPAPSNDPSLEAKPRHNTVFINALTEGWGSATIWYYGRNEKKYLFPSIGVFESWFGKGVDKCCLVRSVPNDVFITIPTGFTTDANGNELGGRVCYQPDAKIWKINLPDREWDALFVVAHNCHLRQLASEAAAEEIFGPDWKKLLDVMPYPIFKDYLGGPPIAGKADFDPLLEQSTSMTIDDNQDL